MLRVRVADDCCDAGACVEAVDPLALATVHDKLAHDMKVQSGHAESVVGAKGEMVHTELSFDPTEGLSTKDPKLPSETEAKQKAKRKKKRKKRS